MSIMPQGLFMSVDEYLHTSFQPDRDYVDGEVQEQNLGERNHSALQSAFVATELFAELDE